jgi:proline iminopeptidase
MPGLHLTMSTSAARKPSPYAIHDGLAVYRFGNGWPVLLMPGPHRFQQPGHRSADALIAGLTQLGRLVITFDPPGSGHSTRPARLGMPEMHQCADEALKIGGTAGRVDALGHSMGGLALLAYAIEQPARISRLVLVGTGSGGPAYMRAPGALWNRSHPAFWRLALLGMLHILWPRLGPQKMMLKFIQRHSFSDASRAQPESIHLRDWLRPKRGRTDWHRIARKLDYAPRLSKIEAPALILVGRFDPQYPPRASEELAAGISNARLVYFEHSGHYPFIEEPQSFWEAVDDFLRPEKAPDDDVS